MKKIPEALVSAGAAAELAKQAGDGGAAGDARFFEAVEKGDERFGARADAVDGQTRFEEVDAGAHTRSVDADLEDVGLGVRGEEKFGGAALRGDKGAEFIVWEDGGAAFGPEGGEGFVRADKGVSE